MTTCGSVACGGPDCKARKFSKRKGRRTLGEGLWLGLAERKQGILLGEVRVLGEGLVTSHHFEKAVLKAPGSSVSLKFPQDCQFEEQ